MKLSLEEAITAREFLRGVPVKGEKRKMLSAAFRRHFIVGDGFVPALSNKRLWIRVMLGESPEPQITDTLRARLHDIPEKVKFNGMGICYYVEDTHDELQALGTLWPKFSGDFKFFIPHRWLSPRNAYGSILDLWSGPYGATRREFIQWATSQPRGEPLWWRA